MNERVVEENETKQTNHARTPHFQSPEISPSEDLLPEKLKGLSWKWLGEDVCPLVLGVNSLNSEMFIEMRPEPMDFDIVELGPWSCASGLQVGKCPRSIIVFMTSHFESGHMLFWNPNSFGNSLGQIPQRQDISHSS